MDEQVLCVDDEPAVLAGFERTLGRRCALHTAESGAAGLERIATDGPYAVVVSDMRMPEMDGIQFLSEVHRVSPDSVLVMLTGHGDGQTASAAINEGRIFRFLVKPCDPTRLAQAIDAALEHHRFIIAEKKLMEGLLGGCDPEQQQKSFADYHATRWPKPSSA